MIQYFIFEMTKMTAKKAILGVSVKVILKVFSTQTPLRGPHFVPCLCQSSPAPSKSWVCPLANQKRVVDQGQIIELETTIANGVDSKVILYCIKFSRHQIFAAF